MRHMSFQLLGINKAPIYNESLLLAFTVTMQRSSTDESSDSDGNINAQTNLGSQNINPMSFSNAHRGSDKGF